MIDERPAWMADALCNTGDAALLALFFPNTTRPDRIYAKSQRAKEVCARCPVREQCLNYALNLNTQPDGVWGGCDELELAQLRRERPTPPRPTDHGTNAAYHAHLRRGDPPCLSCSQAHALWQQHRRTSRAREQVTA